MRKHIFMIARIASLTLGTLLITATAFGASCPYCGQVYGGGGSRDQAYIQRIRAEHEANCPARSKKKSGGNLSSDPRVQGAGKLGEAIHEMLVGNPQDEERKRLEADEAARQATAAAQQRLAEEARQNQKRYDNLSSVLKVSSPGELAPKGFDGDGRTLTGMDSSSTLPLKLGDPADGLRPQGTAIFGTGGGVNGKAAIDQPNDPKVVDLRDKKEPLVVDPLMVKGPQQEPKANNGKSLTDGGVRSAGGDTRSLLYPEEMKKGLFPKNPEQPLINPLREPERWKAYDKASRADFDARIRNNKADEVIGRIDDDPAFSKATERILKEEKVAIYKASEKYHIEVQKAFKKLDKKYGVKDFDEYQKKIQEDPKYEQQVQAVVDNYWKKMHKVGQDAHNHAYNEMLKEVDKFQKRQAQQERGDKQ